MALTTPDWRLEPCTALCFACALWEARRQLHAKEEPAWLERERDHPEKIVLGIRVMPQWPRRGAADIEAPGALGRQHLQTIRQHGARSGAAIARAELGPS